MGATESEPDDHLEAVSRVYGPETWDVYDVLDRGLDPRGPDLLLELARARLTRQSVMLDVGCRDASHLIDLVRSTGASGAGIDPVPRLLDRAKEAVAAAGLGAQIQLVEGVLEHLPWPDGAFDLVWCRDVLELIVGLDAGMAEIARVLRPGGHVIVYTVVATDRLEPGEAALLAQNLTVVPSSLSSRNVETSFDRAGLERVVEEIIGTEWREFAEERTQPVSRDLLRLARLRRRRARIVQEVGEELYGHIESNLHWLAYQFLGKLLPMVYVLRKPA